jgi:GMP reductase
MEIFDYDNILLLPRKCRVESRSNATPVVRIRPAPLPLPVVPPT